MGATSVKKSSSPLPLAVVSLAVLGTACEPSLPPMTCGTLPTLGTPEQLASRPSPFDSVMLRVDNALQAKLCYSRPYARGRTVFGELIPYDTLWRTGANEPTILHLAQPSEIAGLGVEPGAYSIYTVPSQQQWQVVVNESTSQWGLTRDEYTPRGELARNAYTDDVRRQEVGRAPIEIEPAPFTEQLTASFESTGPAEHRLLFDWETTRIVVPIRFRSSTD